jgi:RNA-directed DNA polymerase
MAAGVPQWLLRPLPSNALVDEALLARVEALAARLPDSLTALHRLLKEYRAYREYDAAVNRAAPAVWQAREAILAAPALRVDLLAFAAEHFPEQAQARIFRRLSKDPTQQVRRRLHILFKRIDVREVALPRTADGPWDATGWLHGLGPGTLKRHRQGTRIQEQRGVPALANIAAMRALLGIVSARQLGYFLLATDADEGPYRRFTLPKATGGEREICAPKKQLRWVQRKILDEILAKVPVHDAAHGFVRGRSTVTNAAPHLGARLLVKFDLVDFFTTIHYHRVMGLFARLGYPVGDARFSTADGSTHLAPTLARLCCWTAEPRGFGTAVLPQGAPTSPAITNLVCRRLDARLTGLALRQGGVYTRYADDLTFSFREEVPLGRFRWWVDQVCHQEGFLVNQKKFRVIRPAQRQLVTGIVVNDVLAVPRRERRRFRAIIHNCRLHGVAAEARGNPRFADYLRGLASYIHMVQPEEGADLLRQVDELLGLEQGPPEESP